MEKNEDEHMRNVHKRKTKKSNQKNEYTQQLEKNKKNEFFLYHRYGNARGRSAPSLTKGL